MTSGKVDHTFFQQPTLQLAKSLLGTELVHKTDEGLTAGMIVEVEAYRGPTDKAAHSYGGKITERNRAMFGPPGHAYVYFIYGMHYCMNVVSSGEGKPEGILLRALQPTQGIRLMARRRGYSMVPGTNDNSKVPGSNGNAIVPGTNDKSSDDLKSLPAGKRKALTNGPGKLCQAMGITKEQYGFNLIDSPLFLRHYQDPIPDNHILAGPRINIDYAEEAKDYPWRFWIKDNPFVSKG